MIRFFEKNDYEAIYSLGEMLHVNYRNLYKLNEVAEDSYSNVLVATEDNQVVGFLMYVKLIDSVDIVDIVVSPTKRRNKIGSRLINYLISELDETTKVITLEVSVDNEAAISLYDRFGFEIVHKRPNYYGNKDAYLMGRVIDE